MIRTYFIFNEQVSPDSFYLAKVVKRSVHFLTTCQKVNIGFVVKKEIIKHNIFEKIFLLWVNFLKEKTFDVL